jgi:hypothetical protein
MEYGDVTVLGDFINKKTPYVDVRAYADINTAVTAIGSTSTTLVVSNAQTLTGNLTIPSTLTLKILQGGSIIKASTYTLTINGNFEAGLYQVFSGFSPGNITFGVGAIKEALPEWWNKNTTPGTTDMFSAITAAINSLPSGGQVFFAKNIYALSAPLHILSNISLLGTGKASELRDISTIENHFLYTSNDINISIRNLYINGNRHGRLSGGGDATSGSSVSLANVDGTYFPRENNIIIENCYITGAGFNNIGMYNVHNVVIKDNYLSDGRDSGIAAVYGCSKLIITGNYIKENQFAIGLSSSGMTPTELSTLGYIRDCIVSHNVMTVANGGDYGIEVDGTIRSEFSDNQINMINGAYGIRFIGLNAIGGSEITENNNRVLGNNIHFSVTASATAIQLYLTGESDILIDNNTISSDVTNSAYGIDAYNSSLRVSNSVMKNMGTGIYVDSQNFTHRYLFNNNRITGSGTAINCNGTYLNISNVYLRDNTFADSIYYDLTIVSGYAVYYSGILTQKGNALTPDSFKSDNFLIYSNIPTSGTWKIGEIVYNSIPVSGNPVGWVCLTSGTFSTATDNTGDTDGSTAVITGMTDTSDFSIGHYVTVSAGFLSASTPYKIIAKTSTTITLDTNSNSSQSNVTVATPSPTFVAFGGDMSFTNTRYKLGIFSRDLTVESGNVSITGVGFTPKVVIFSGGVNASFCAFYNGFDDGSVHYVTASQGVITPGTFIITSSSSASIFLLADAVGSVQYAYISSMDSDGFTLTWTKMGAPTGTASIFYIAYR